MKAQISLEYLFLILISSFVFFIVIVSILGIENIAKQKQIDDGIKQVCKQMENSQQRICYFGGEQKFYFEREVNIKNKDSSFEVYIEKRKICEIKNSCDIIFSGFEKKNDCFIIKQEFGKVSFDIC